MVFVDEAKIPYGNMKMSHLVADSHEELLDMVRTIGVKVKWIQYPGTPKEHFDICASKRELAIKAGAVPVKWTELAIALSNRSSNGKLPFIKRERAVIMKMKNVSV